MLRQFQSKRAPLLACKPATRFAFSLSLLHTEEQANNIVLPFKNAFNIKFHERKSSLWERQTKNDNNDEIGSFIAHLSSWPAFLLLFLALDAKHLFTGINRTPCWDRFARSGICHPTQHTYTVQLRNRALCVFIFHGDAYCRLPLKKKQLSNNTCGTLRRRKV